MSRLVAAVFLLSGCLEDPEILVGTQPLVTESEPPILGFDHEDGDVVLVPGSISGFARDPEQAPATLPVSLLSDRDGVLWYGNPDGDGTWTWDGALSTGPHLLTLVSEDREANPVSASVSVVARTNSSPLCGILSPRDGSTVAIRSDLAFEAGVRDEDGDLLVILWRSSLQGALGEGASFERRLTKAGAHDISIEVSDGFETCRDVVTVFVQ